MQGGRSAILHYSSVRVTGQTIGQYEVQRLLGAGGMGEVYLARDKRLGRSVAIKILPAFFAQDRERIARFEREARVLASLNHTNIATLFGLEQSDGKQLLVMELVEGDTLAERIARGPIPVEDALKLARQIVDALEAAHEKGIVHRDLKPANVKIAPDGKVKVLDFGLAKALTGASPQADLLSSPTISVAAATYAGAVMGTAPYMSPEQAKGQETDRRTDVFAFGCVLFEMLTGRRTFHGDSVTEAIASVLAREPEMSALPANISPKLLELLRRCLEKDPKRRWQAIGDVRVELDTILADPHGKTLPAAAAARLPLWQRALPAVIAGVVMAAIGATAAWTLRPAPVAGGITRFSYALPKDQNFTRTGRHVVAIAPDGTNVVYVANNQLYLKPMAGMDAKPIPGTLQDVNTPFFSPDGRWVAFCAVPEGKLKKIALTGGASVTLADIDNPYGAHWYADDQILVGQGPKGIVRISANGGKPETLIEVKANEFAQTPQMLPGGTHILFTLATGTDDDRWDKAQIVVQSVASKERRVLIDGGSDARYVPTGHIVYALGATMFAVPVDVKTLQLTGGPVPIAEGLSRSAAVNTAATFFSFSATGSLVSIPGGLTGGVQALALALVNRAGEKKLLGLPAQPYYQPRVSPDGKQVAVEVNDGGREMNIWVYELAGATAMRRLTFGGRNRSPVWTRDGQRIVFRSDRGGDWSLYWQRADGSGAAERLTTTDRNSGDTPEASSPDGNTLTFFRGVATGGVWALSPTGDRKPKVLVDTPLNKTAALNSVFSPDGRWFAYESGESSRSEVYVQPFPPTGAKYQVTTSGSTNPLWSPDGKQLFVVDNNGSRFNLDTFDIRTQPSFAVGNRAPLPIDGFQQRGGTRAYDITPDGEQFLVMIPPSETASGARASLQINVTLNWFQDLKQRVPGQ